MEKKMYTKRKIEMEKSCIRNGDSFSLIQLIPIRFKVKNIEPMDKILVCILSAAPSFSLYLFL